MSARVSSPCSRRLIASRFWCGVSLGGRPKLCPRAFALSRPSPVRARINSRSNSASPPRTVSILSSVTSVGNNAPHCADDGRERPRAIGHACQVTRSNVLLNRGAQLRRQTLHAQTKRTRAGREAGPVVLEGGVIETDHDRHFYQAL